MAYHIDLRHFLLGLEGLALLRTWFQEDNSAAERRVAEVRSVLAESERAPGARPAEVLEQDCCTGYTRWSGGYDSRPDPLRECEGALMREIMGRFAVGDALDAGCGTGRHTEFLLQKGHRVIGVDASAGMLEIARTRLPDVEFRVGDVGALPVQSSSMDLVVCALVLSHCRDLISPVGELARVTRPGGHVLISELHPTLSLVLQHAVFSLADGSLNFVRNFPHSHASFIKAFARAGLTPVDCHETELGAADIAPMTDRLSAQFGDVAEAVRDALTGLPGSLIWELSRNEPSVRMAG